MHPVAGVVVAGFCMDLPPDNRSRCRASAARWGEKRAQFALGVDYFNGRRGVTADKVQGLAWLTLAAERKDPYYVSILASARAQSTPESSGRPMRW
jgi:TPR repeat protein